MSRPVLAVDFASRYSAAALFGPDGQLVDFLTSDFGPNTQPFSQCAKKVRSWAESLAQMVNEHFDVEDVRVVVEDLSHSMANPAHTFRLQGVLRLSLDEFHFFEPVMVYPQVWQKFFGWRKTVGTTSKGFAKFACEALGIEISGTTGKATVDVRDACLIAVWAQRTEEVSDERRLDF